jgi:hypothetical protein
MPNCFTLTRKSHKAFGPVPLALIDEELCAHLGVEVDNKFWLHGWYNCIGMMLAIGKSFDECREIFKESSELQPIIDYLDTNFITDAWAEIGRR